MDFNRILMALQNKHGIQDGMTWTTNYFQQKKGTGTGITWTSMQF
jgi:hypothetical protein